MSEMTDEELIAALREHAGQWPVIRKQRAARGCDLAEIAAGRLAALVKERDEARHDFKNFHRNLCDRFDYCHDERDWQRDQISLIEYIARRLASLEAEVKGRVVVKPLDWKLEDESWWSAQPGPFMPSYEVRQTPRGGVRARMVGTAWSPFEGSVDDAKAAAQADFERRILSALSVPTAPAVTDEMRKAREALVLEYAVATKRNAHELPGIPVTVVVEHFRKFADKLAALTGGAQ